MDKRELANAMVKRSLSEALVRLLGDKAISEITVSALIEEAHVARASFYRNFNTLEEVLKYELDRITRQYIAECPRETVDFADYDYLVWKFGFYKRNAEKLLAMKKAGLGGLILYATNEITLRGFPAEWTFAQQAERYFAAGAFYNVALNWLLAGAEESPEQMAMIFTALYTRGAALPSPAASN